MQRYALPVIVDVDGTAVPCPVRCITALQALIDDEIRNASRLIHPVGILCIANAPLYVPDRVTGSDSDTFLHAGLQRVTIFII